MKLLLIISFSITSLLIISCDLKEEISQSEINPAADGFNENASDTKAIAIADEVMEAMGGREAWDNTNELKWTFFGNRQHEWNKAEKKAKIISPNDRISIELNLEDKSGSASRGDVKFTESDSLDFFLKRGNGWWINDSYWLVMPFKLKDSGVTLKYIGKDTSQIGRNSDVIEMTFADVGVTPDNKYLVYVDDSSRLVTQWDYYTNFQDSLPRFQSPWNNYKKYGDILLSGGSIRGMTLTDISVN